LIIAAPVISVEPFNGGLDIAGETRQFVIHYARGQAARAEAGPYFVYDAEWHHSVA
jgi:hypothetical protein